jgi:hypothetical protein
VYFRAHDKCAQNNEQENHSLGVTHVLNAYRNNDSVIREAPL